MASKQHPLGYDSETVNLSTGRKYRYVDISPPEGTKPITTALLLHGFPDSSYGWRHQIKGWSSRGIRLIIPDTLGYTGTSQPTDPNEYSFKSQADDYEALVREIGLPDGEKLVLISHDWGSGIAMRLAQYKPHLVKAIASLCIPFSMAKVSPEYLPIESLVEILPAFAYQLFFVDPRSAAVIDANVEKFIAILYFSAKQIASGQVPSFEKKGVVESWLNGDRFVLPDNLTQEEFDTTVAEIKKGAGFSAMINYYRNGRINHELDNQSKIGDLHPDIAKLLIIPNADPCVPPHLAANETKNTEVVQLEGLCGHWVQLEQPDTVEKVVGEWVERVVGK